jgi:hypothetical protein
VMSGGLDWGAVLWVGLGGECSLVQCGIVVQCTMVGYDINSNHDFAVIFSVLLLCSINCHHIKQDD